MAPRRKPLAPLPADLPEPVRAFVQHLRWLYEHSGLTLKQLAEATHRSPSSWSRYLSAREVVPEDALSRLAAITRASPFLVHQLRTERQQADLAHQQVRANAGAAVHAGAVPAGAPRPAGAAPALPRPRSGGPAEPTPMPLPRQLPRDVSHFTGRAEELARLDAMLAADAYRSATVLITAIDGTPGVGKTALAVRWGHQVRDRFPDGELYVNLRGYDASAPVAPEQALDGFLRALDVPAQRVPHSLEEQAALYRSILARRRMLVVLDNAANPEQVRPLLPGAPGCVVLVTSRSRLSGLVVRDGAARLTLPPLPAGDAVDLLRQIVGPQQVDAQVDAAEALSRRCSYLPLALRIVAERAATGHRTLAGLAAERDGLDALAAEDDDATSVRAVFSWSYRALSPAVARAFRLLSLHPGQQLGTAAAAALLEVDEAAARRLLGLLVAGHLLDEAAQDRFQLHDLLRVYAAECAAAEEPAVDRDAARHRLFGWYLHTAAAAARRLMPNRHQVELGPVPPGLAPLDFADHAAALAWCEAELGNVVALVPEAARTGEHVVAWKLPAALWGYFYLRKPWRDWIALSRTGLDVARALGDPAGEAWSEFALGAAHRDLRRTDEAVAHYERALPLWQRIGDLRGEAMTLNNLGVCFADAGDMDTFVTYLDRSLQVRRTIGDRRGESQALTNLGEGSRVLRRFADAQRYLEQALAVNREIGEVYGTAMILTNLGETQCDLGNPARALDYLAEAAEIRVDLGDVNGDARGSRITGRALAALGRRDEARESYLRALEIFGAVGDPEGAEVQAELDALDADGPAGT